MNSTRLFDALNSTEKLVNNGSTIEEITPEEEVLEEYEDEWFDFQIEGKVYITCILIIASLGVTGNVMSFIIMPDAKLSSFAYSIDIKWMAVSDSLLLIIVSTEDIMDKYGYYDRFLAYHVVLCKLWIFFKFAIFTMSPWLVVALTLDRFVCIVFLLSRHVLCTRSKTTKLCLTLTLVTVALNVVALVLLNTDDNECSCSELPVISRFIIFMKLVVKSSAPCVLVLVFNIITISRIRKSLSFRQQFTRDTICKAVKDKEDKSTVPLLFVSVLAFVTLLPRTVTEIVEFILTALGTDYIAQILTNNIWPICNVIYLMNFAQNFYILIASWPEYRMVIKNIFSRGKASKKTPRRQTSSQSPSTQFSETCVSNIADAVSMPWS